MKLLFILLFSSFIGITSAQSKQAHHRSDHPKDHYRKTDERQGEAPYEQFPFPLLQVVQPLALNFPEDTIYPRSEHESSQPQSSQHEDEGPKWTDIIVAIFTVVLGAAAIASGFIAYYQWKALLAQELRLKESIEKSQSSADIQAKIMESSIRAMEDANSLTRKGLLYEQRPWITVDADISMLAVQNDRVTASLVFTFRNIGKIAANDIFCTTRLIKHPDNIVLFSRLIAEMSTTTMPHYYSTTRYGYHNIILPGQALSEEYLCHSGPEVCKPDVRLVIYGCTFYRFDGNSDVHHTSFCYRIDCVQKNGDAIVSGIDLNIPRIMSRNDIKMISQLSGSSAN
jgi:hypothetical protein